MISKMHPKWHCTIKTYTALIKCLVRLQNTTTIGHGVDPHTKYHAQSVFLPGMYPNFTKTCKSINF